MQLKFPTNYNVDYPEENRSYYSSYRSEFEKILLKASNYYCMYCGRTLKNYSCMEFNIEHSIETGGYSTINEGKDIKFLKHCKFNMSAACYSCNQKYKNKMMGRVADKYINKKIDCNKNKCIEPCKEYLEIKREYYKINSLILQPEGRSDNEQHYEIGYNLLKHVFEPLTVEPEYNDEIKAAISEHIARFHLNKEMFSECILDICETIIVLFDNFGEEISTKKIFNVINLHRYSNVLGEIFVKFLEKEFTNSRELKEFCTLLIILDYL